MPSALFLRRGESLAGFRGSSSIVELGEMEERDGIFCSMVVGGEQETERVRACLIGLPLVLMIYTKGE